VSVLHKVFTWGKSVSRSFLDSHCSLHAAGLTYYSMLALIPILCCVLVLAKAAHVDEYARRQINGQIDAMIANVEKGQSPLGFAKSDDNDAKAAERQRKRRIAVEEFSRQARSFSDLVFSRIDKFDVRRMGLIGPTMLLWTVISSLGQVEVSMNEIWRVPKARPLWKKACLYLFVAIVMPVLAMLAMSMPVLNVAKNIIVATMGSVWLTKWVSDGLVWCIDFWAFRLLVSFGFATLGFGAFLWVFPNCRVRFRSAWYGGALTAALFFAVLKVCAVAQVGIAKSSALYGSFAFLPIVLAWFYLSWQVVLLGACFARAFSESRTVETSVS